MYLYLVGGRYTKRYKVVRVLSYVESFGGAYSTVTSRSG